ncbi:MAG TPA: hypothetical protein VKV27_00195 [Solirubrobacteraceae bacterium]|nr:hypothetical protein [Solirubrobacteraceae bacterium]
MHNLALRRALEAHAVDAGRRLAAIAAAGAEMPFELVAERGGGRAPLYRYRPLTAEFIRAHAQTLAQLPSHAAAIALLAQREGLDRYLAEHGAPPAPDRRSECEAALAVFLACVFCERTTFSLEPAQFQAACAELERALRDGHCTATVIAPVDGVRLAEGVDELALDGGLSLVRGDTIGEAPVEAVWGEGEQPRVLAVLAVADDAPGGEPVAEAADRFRELVAALRLHARGGYALGPVAWACTDAGTWRAVGISVAGRPGPPVTLGADERDELRAFCRLVARPAPTPELAWALDRFQMGCQRDDPLQALTDNLLALRALLEPEGPASGRLAQRLAVICAPAQGRAQLAQRTARAVALERAAIAGLDTRSAQDAEAMRELAENLRAILRDAFCGHLAPDLAGLADELLADAVSGRPLTAAA